MLLTPLKHCAVVLYGVPNSFHIALVIPILSLDLFLFASSEGN
jgi:hypothetical protein